MHFPTLSDHRESAQRTRKAPREPVRVVATFCDGGSLKVEASSAPVEVVVEATDAAGELAEWLDDHWWTRWITPLGENAVTVRLAPTPGALLHPVVLHHMEMLRRVVPGWRIVGHAHLEDVFTDDDIGALAQSGYHEIRFIDGPRRKVPSSDRGPWRRPFEELFGHIRQVQADAGVATPILIRLPADDGLTLRSADRTTAGVAEEPARSPL